MDKELLNYIKYCLGYVRITREKTVVAQQKYSINLPTEYFDLVGLLNRDTDENLGELINLEKKRITKKKNHLRIRLRIFITNIEMINSQNK